MRIFQFRAVAAFAAVLCCTPVRAESQTVASSVIAATSEFALHSALWVNLHHFLYVTARARAGLDRTRESVTASLGDTAGFGALPPELAAGWNDALTYYSQAIAPKDVLFDSSLVSVNNALAKMESAQNLQGSTLSPPLITALEKAAPAYRALWWPRHDAINRKWAASMLAMLKQHGADAARDESKLFREPWITPPLRVDVVAYANWAGAYTTNEPAHATISSQSAGNLGVYGFEVLFHEVLHTMDDTVFRAIDHAFRDAGKTLPRDPTHPFIFFTAGEITRRYFPAHVPFAEQFGLWTRSPDYVKILPLLRQHWKDYTDGRITLDEATRRIAVAW